MTRVLVIQLARFGDLLQTKRLLRSLQMRDNEVHVCVDASLADLARIVYPEVRVHTVRAHGGDARTNSWDMLLENKKSFARLAAQQFSAVYNLNYAGMNYALSALFDAECVRGYSMRNGQRQKDAWTDLAFRWTRRRASSPMNLVDFWAGFAPEMIEPEKVNPIPNPHGGGVGVVLAGRHSRRSLPPAMLAPLVQAAAGAQAKKVYLLGSQAEKTLATAFKKHASKKLLGMLEDLTGRTNWAELVDVVSGLDMLLTPDTGAMHLAAHLGTPTQAFFLASAWTWETGPYGKGHRIYQARTECVPCQESQTCPCDTECLNPFSSRELMRLLATRPDRISRDQLPANLLVLESAFDALGQIYVPHATRDPWHDERTSTRALIREYLQGKKGAQRVPHDLALHLFQERDWMLENEKTAYSSIL